MASGTYEVVITLGNDDKSKYSVQNSTVTNTFVPAEYTTSEQEVAHRILTDWVEILSKANIAKLVIQKQ